VWATASQRVNEHHLARFSMMPGPCSSYSFLEIHICNTAVSLVNVSFLKHGLPDGMCPNSPGYCHQSKLRTFVRLCSTARGFALLARGRRRSVPDRDGAQVLAAATNRRPEPYSVSDVFGCLRRLHSALQAPISGWFALPSALDCPRPSRVSFGFCWDCAAKYAP
jgi:hypothetical protein